MLTLHEVIDRYLGIASRFGAPVALSAFGLPRGETERLFSAYEEDYHISRYLHFVEESGDHFSINGFPATHVNIDEQIRSLL
jgi:hypothetical protein